MAKAKEDKFTLRQFKDKSSNWFLNNKHYHLNEQGLIVFIAGGKEDEEEIKYLEEFCKRNKKVFKERELSIFESEPREYSTITYGKYSQKPLNEIVDIDKRYARWLYDSVTDIKIKNELKELLKLK